MLSEAAAMALAAATRHDHRRLATILDGMKAAPFRRGDLQERDAHGRVNELLLSGDWLDHAARELRVIRLERVED